MRGESNRTHGGTEGNRPPWHRTFQRGLQFVAPDKVRVAVVLTVALAMAALNAVQPMVLKYIFDTLTGGGIAEKALLIGVAGLAGIVAVKEILQALSNWLSWKVRLKVHYRVLEAVVDRLNALPLSYHREQSVGATMARMDRAIQGYLDALSRFAFDLLPTAAYLFLGLFLMMRMDTTLTLVVVAFVPLPALIGHIAAKEQTRREQNLLTRWSDIYARWNEVLHGIATVKSFAKEDDEKERFLDGVDGANDVVDRGVAYDSTMGGLSNLVAALARIAAIAVGGYLILQGQVTLGTLVAFMGYIDGLFGPVQNLTGAYQTMRKAEVSLNEIFEVLDAEDGLQDAPDALEVTDLEGRVTFENVSLHDDRGRPILDRVSLDIQPGETVAIVGPSGAGKTTLMKVLQRLYDPCQGRVMVDGHDLRDIKQKPYRRRIGIVPQEPVLFNDTVRNSIRYADPDASDERVQAAARAAHAHEFVEQMRGGYEANVGDRGGKLSSGQRQRIAIARALLKEPDMVILDEPTSALDAESEALVTEALDELTRGRTTFIIAHRLSTVVGADRIVVLRDGRVEAVGTHEELLNQDGYYALLVHHQVSGLFDDYPAPSDEDAEGEAETPPATPLPGPPYDPFGTGAPTGA